MQDGTAKRMRSNDFGFTGKLVWHRNYSHGPFKTRASPLASFSRRTGLNLKDDAKFGLAAHHSRIRFIGLFERIGFNHGSHAAKFGEI